MILHNQKCNKKYIMRVVHHDWNLGINRTPHSQKTKYTQHKDKQSNRQWQIKEIQKGFHAFKKYGTFPKLQYGLLF